MALTEIPIELSSTPSIVDNGNATAITIDSSERVSINTTSATELLNVAHTSGNGAGVEFAGNGNTIGSTSAFYGQGSSSDAYVWNRANSPVLFGTNNTERMRIDGATGSVGIGTTVPTQSDTNSHFLYGGGSNGFNLSATEGPIALSSNVTINSGEKYVFNGFASKNYQLDGSHVWMTAASGTAGNAISFTERMRIDGATGNVGIGTGSTTPAKKLVVQGTNHIATLLNTSDTANEYAQLLLQAGSSTNFIWTQNQNSTNYGGAHSLNIYTQQNAPIAFFTGGNNERMRISGSTGNVSIADGNLVVAAGHGIDFSAGTSAAGMTEELFDDYEEGTFTPSITLQAGASPTQNVTSTTRYVKTGGTVMVEAQLNITGYSATSTQQGYDIRIAGLPFASVAVIGVAAWTTHNIVFQRANSQMTFYGTQDLGWLGQHGQSGTWDWEHGGIIPPNQTSHLRFSLSYATAS